MRQIETSKKCKHCLHHGKVWWEGRIDHRCEKVECNFKDGFFKKMTFEKQANF